MEPEKKQFDVLIGGSENIPFELNILKFATARVKEIEFMKKSIDNPTNTKLIFQKLPIHMRRRVMSHNVKRLPCKSREGHLNQLEKSGMPPKQKRPSRKHRRRPTRLQSEYLRRQRRVTWLETHVWHAKRFHMVEQWGYKLPDRPCDKAFRACYRASAKHCLLQDVSYLGCVELTGPESVLVDGFKKVTDPATGLSIGAKAFLKGNREGRITVYNVNSYPKLAIGDVTFMWGNYYGNTTENRTLWIWAHASFYSDIIHLFINLFELTRVDDMKDSSILTYTNNNVQLKELKLELNRFRLTGPLSQGILKQIIQFPNKENVLKDSYLFENNQTIEVFERQYKFWTNLNITSSGELAPHLIIGLNILDPRFSYPNKRTKACFDDDQDCFVPDFDQTISCSLLWNEGVRESVTKSKISNAEICKLNSKQLVPGLNYSLISQKAALPIVLVQRPGNRDNHLGYGSGYDIIVPKGWGLPLWQTMIMWGARAGGLRENRVDILENKYGNELHSDTKVGQLEERRVETRLIEKYFRLPPKKRTNYIQIGIVAPFRPAWKLLIKEWCDGCDLEPIDFESYHVIRDRKKLNILKECLVKKSQPISECDINFNEPSLVSVKLKLKHRGLIHDNGLICLPLDSDLTENTCPLEPHHEDLNQAKRKSLRKDHKDVLKKLRRQRVKNKRRSQDSDENDPLLNKKHAVTDTKPIIERYRDEMRVLWLPQPDKVRYSCSRQVIGFITHGDFSFCDAKSAAVGYITLQSLKYINSNSVLVRNNSSRKYRIADIDVIL